MSEVAKRSMIDITRQYTANGYPVRFLESSKDGVIGIIDDIGGVPVKWNHDGEVVVNFLQSASPRYRLKLQPQTYYVDLYYDSKTGVVSCGPKRHSVLPSSKITDPEVGYVTTVTIKI